MNKKILIGIVLGIILPIAAYTGSPLFFDTTTDEPLPNITSTMTFTNGTTTSVTEIPQMIASGQFTGVNDGIHNAEGLAKVVQLMDGKQLLRLEDFKATNGPDLYVYLATDQTAQEYVNLGKLKANIGNQNYEIPQGTDLTKYDTALVWCKQFSVLFGSAEIS